MEGNIFRMAELILQNGACGRLVPGWSLRLLKSLEDNNLKKLANVLRLGKLKGNDV